MTKRGNGGGHNNHAFGSGAKEGWSGGEDERGAESLEKNGAAVRLTDLISILIFSHPPKRVT